MNKVLVKIHFPIIEEKYDMWLPTNKRIYDIIVGLVKTIDELNDMEELESSLSLYNRYTGACYDLNSKIKDTDIVNGTELILI